MKSKISIVIGVVFIAALSFGFVHSTEHVSKQPTQTTNAVTSAPLGGIPLSDNL
jgi:hypothetical protein